MNLYYLGSVMLHERVTGEQVCGRPSQISERANTTSKNIEEAIMISCRHSYS